MVRSFRLSHDCRQELLLLALLSPCMYTDLRAEPMDRVFCKDASGFGAGACASPIDKKACLELLRHADHKGFHTRLQTKSSLYSDGDLDAFDAPLHFDLNVPPNFPRPSCLISWGFSGRRQPFKDCRKHGLEGPRRNRRSRWAVWRSFDTRMHGVDHWSHLQASCGVHSFWTPLRNLWSNEET